MNTRSALWVKTKIEVISYWKAQYPTFRKLVLEKQADMLKH